MAETAEQYFILLHTLQWPVTHVSFSLVSCISLSFFFVVFSVSHMNLQVFRVENNNEFKRLYKQYLLYNHSTSTIPVTFLVLWCYTLLKHGIPLVMPYD